MLPVLKSKIAEKLREEFQTELGAETDNLVQSLVQDFAPPWLGSGSRFIAILGSTIAPAGEQHGALSEEYFWKIRFLVRSPFNMRTMKQADLDDLTLGLYKLERKARARLHGSAGIDILNECNTTLDELESPALHSLIRWHQTTAEPILLPSDYFGSEQVIEDTNSPLVPDLKFLDPVGYDYEGIAIDAHYRGVRTYDV
jgi:hypothetical protein